MKSIYVFQLLFLLNFCSEISAQKSHIIELSVSPMASLPVGKFKFRLNDDIVTNASSTLGAGAGIEVAYRYKNFLLGFGYSFQSFNSMIYSKYSEDFIDPVDMAIVRRDTLGFRLKNLGRWVVHQPYFTFGYLFSKKHFYFQPNIGLGLNITQSPYYEMHYGKTKPIGNGTVGEEFFYRYGKSYKAITQVFPSLSLSIRSGYSFNAKYRIGVYAMYNQTFQRKYYYKNDKSIFYQGLLSNINFGVSFTVNLNFKK